MTHLLQSILALLIAAVGLMAAQTKADRTVAMDSTDISKYPRLNQTSQVGERRAEVLKRAIAQFKVETNPRYLRRDGKTFCNIFARDFCHAMNVKLPWRLANDLYDWLPSKDGRAAGWQAVTPEEAQRAANEGRPVLVSWKNPAKKTVTRKDGTKAEVPGHGHIAVVRPGDVKTGPHLANAGAKNLEDVPVTKIFSAEKLKTVKYYANR